MSAPHPLAETLALSVQLESYRNAAPTAAHLMVVNALQDLLDGEDAYEVLAIVLNDAAALMAIATRCRGLPTDMVANYCAERIHEVISSIPVMRQEGLRLAAVDGVAL